MSEFVKAKKIVFPRAFELSYETEEIHTDMDDYNVLIRTQYSMISAGTELALFTATHSEMKNPENTYAKLPFYPGYASVGEVISVGKLVKEVSAGDQVFTAGNHANYCVVPYSGRNVMKLPKGMNPQKALFTRPAEISTSALIHSGVIPDSNVVVLGMGMIGNFAAQLFTIQGARSIGVDVVEERLQMARQTNNIAHTIQSGENVILLERIKDFTGGLEPDIVVEATGNPALINVALELVRRHGRVILLGSPRGSVEINVYKHIHSKGVALIGAHGSVKGIDGLPDTVKLANYSMDLIHKGILSVDPMLTHILPADQAMEAYHMLLNKKENALGIILDWQNEF